MQTRRSPWLHRHRPSHYNLDLSGRYTTPTCRCSLQRILTFMIEISIMGASEKYVHCIFPRFSLCAFVKVPALHSEYLRCAFRGAVPA
jgi:hypothetical protein